jgi:hypothetical protein
MQGTDEIAMLTEPFHLLPLLDFPQEPLQESLLDVQ